MRGTRHFAALLSIFALGLVLGGAAHGQIVSPNNPQKVFTGTVNPASRIPIVCTADLIPTGFTCGTGLGPFTSPLNAINDPDQFSYFRGTCVPGAMVTIESFRTTDDMDPAFHVCEGDLCGVDNAGWAAFTCPPGVNLLAAADDDIGPLCAAGAFSDPSATFVCPPGGIFTLAVYDFLGLGPAPEFEVHAANVIAPVPALGDFGTVVLALFVIGGAWYLLARRRGDLTIA